MELIHNGIILPGSVNWEDVERKRQVKVDCLNFVLNLTMTHPHQGYERINGWNQIFFYDEGLR